MNANDERRRVVVRRLTAKIRRCIGKGSTESTRGLNWMKFARGRDAFDLAVINLTAAFGRPMDSVSGEGLTFVDPDTRRPIHLAGYADDTNNFATVGYM